jgi:N-acetylmuramate 1-kinase
MPQDLRLEELQQWLVTLGEYLPDRIEVASADASFRRYFRVWHRTGDVRIAMDAPPAHEDLPTYLKVSALLESCGVHVPHIYAQSVAQGFSILEDLGSTHMLTALGEGRDPEQLYADALDALLVLQRDGAVAARNLPLYDAPTLLREMRLLPEWYCGRHLQLNLNAAEQAMLESTFQYLVTDALQQPQVFVHRDYHSRNLMMTAQRSPGVIDFQDALHGPVGYDLASILKDCYVAWPRQRVEQWLARYRDQLLQNGPRGAALAGESFARFLHWFDMIGLQRHLKVLGIFARLCWRDGKSGYLHDLPRTLEYVRDVCTRYPELQAFSTFVESRLVPGLEAANKRALARQ